MVAAAAGASFWRPAEANPAPAPTPVSDEVFADVVRNGEAGFVATEFAYALGPDASASNACPRGLTGGVRGLVEQLKARPEGARREGESDQGYQRRLNMMVNTAPNGQNICMNPQAGPTDPNWRMVEGRDAIAQGIDLDGDGKGKGKSAATCGHPEFRGAQGQRGIDNQFYRVIGCTTGFQSTGAGNGFQTEMYTGSWGILVSLKGVDSLANDPEVEVGIYANADPLQLSAARNALPFATYAVHRDKRYHATAKGRIVNGVLTSGAMDVRLINVVNSMSEDRELRDARVRLTFTPDGGMEGYLAGYSPIDSIYNVQFGVRTSRNAKGELAPERMRIQTSVGRAGALGYSCNGVYQAMQQAADGHRDPATGRCTTISTQYKIRLMPAFVVDTKTQSINAPLAMRK
ncbi:hypothetical protein C0V78_11800 [Novosphingobium sp. TH158]|nr:hypothetical protein C0V78_11800 [Novosphingobium sp. TH158]